MAKNLEEEILKYINEVLEERKKLLESGWEEFSRNLKKALDSFALHLKVDFAPVGRESLKGLEALSKERPAEEGPSVLPFILTGIRGLRGENSQGRLINHLLNALAKIVNRAVLFVVKEGKLVGWDGRGFEGMTELDFRKMVFPLSSESVFSKVVEKSGIYQGKLPVLKGDRRALSLLGGEPEESILVPIVVRGKVSGLIYADEWPERTEIKHPEAVEILVDFAEAMVELLPIRAKYPVQAKEKIKIEREEPSAAEEVPSLGDTTQKEVVFKATGAPSPFTEEDTRPGISREVMELEEEVEELEVPSAAQPTPSSFEPEMEEEIEIEEEEEIPEEDRALYEAAKRKARVLVSDLILYNRDRIEKAKEKGNIYEELKDEIDLAIEIYKKKVGNKVKKDYLYEELLKKVADGNPSLLKGYPGV